MRVRVEVKKKVKMRIVVKVRIKKRMIWRAKRKKKRISDWLIEVRERKRIKGLEKK